MRSEIFLNKADSAESLREKYLDSIQNGTNESNYYSSHKKMKIFFLLMGEISRRDLKIIGFSLSVLTPGLGGRKTTDSQFTLSAEKTFLGHPMHFLHEACFLRGYRG